MCSNSKFCKAWRMPFFGEEDIEEERVIHIDKAFSIHEYNTILKRSIKFLFVCYIGHTYIGGWITNEYPSFYMAYLTLWTVLGHFLYMGFSFLLSIVPAPWTLKGTWLLASWANVFGIIVVLLFWGTEYKPGKTVLDYYEVSMHFGTWMVCFIDSFLINKTPIRLKHMIFPIFIAILYLIWSAIQGLIPIDNPHKGPDAKSQSMYAIVQWDIEPTKAFVTSIIIVFIIVPIFHLLFWGLSLCCRPYLKKEEGKDNDDDDDDIEAKVYET